ncbi:FadR/GntR family transcriptional regulator [Streptomyces sp. NPDC020742]|uniref:FadR/GntR family transcriptional regulator n=1 Tax=Streptomyces sp. NPDC020742 TaxID=3154897 RepID=UPI0033CD06A4
MALSDSRTSTVPARRVNAMQVVLEHLRTAVERGDLAVGDKLPSEAELGRRFGVSRSVVREALRALQALGLTVSHAGKGTYVAAPEKSEGPTFGAYPARDLVEARRHVEIPVAAYAATRRTQADLDHLHELRHRMEHESDTAAWAALDTQFHVTLAQCSGNLVFRSVIEAIRDALTQQSTFLNVLDRDRRERSNEEHRAIVEAITRSSEEGSVQAMSRHLDHVETALAALCSSIRPGGRGDEQW